MHQCLCQFVSPDFILICKSAACLLLWVFPVVSLDFALPTHIRIYSSCNIR